MSCLSNHYFQTQVIEQKDHTFWMHPISLPLQMFQMLKQLSLECSSFQTPAMENRKKTQNANSYTEMK